MKKKLILFLAVIFALIPNFITASAYYGSDGSIKLKGVTLKVHLARIYPTPRPGMKRGVFTRSSFRITPDAAYTIKSGSLVFIDGKSRVFKGRKSDKTGYFNGTAEAGFSGYHTRFTAIVQLKHIKSGKVLVIAKKFRARIVGGIPHRSGKLKIKIIK